MPIYEYRCDKCSKTHEIIQKFSDPPVTQCPECGGPVAKQMSLGSFHLKGGGWYATDYKKPGAKSESSSTTSVPAKTDSKTSGSGDK